MHGVVVITVRFLSGLLAALLLLALSARAAEVSVAVAANFALPMKQVAAEFEKDTGHKVLASPGSTGKFYAQIRNGAPFDILLAADDETPRKLLKEGHGAPGSAFTYAVGKLVLWSATPGLVDTAGAVLKKGSFAHLAVADPRLAPYGAAAMETLKALGLRDAVQPRVVTAENATQAYQFIRSGNAELGFVALSQVLKDGAIEGSSWRVPENLYAPLRQDAVLLEVARGKPAPEALMRYLQGDKARAIIQSFGYGLQ